MSPTVFAHQSLGLAGKKNRKTHWTFSYLDVSLEIVDGSLIVNPQVYNSPLSPRADSGGGVVDWTNESPIKFPAAAASGRKTINIFVQLIRLKDVAVVIWFLRWPFHPLFTSLETTTNRQENPIEQPSNPRSSGSIEAAPRKLPSYHIQRRLFFCGWPQQWHKRTIDSSMDWAKKKKKNRFIVSTFSPPSCSRVIERGGWENSGRVSTLTFVLKSRATRRGDFALQSKASVDDSIQPSSGHFAATFDNLPLALHPFHFNCHRW